MPSPGVDFFRVDRSRTTRGRLTVSGVLIACGATTVGAHLVHRIPVSTGHTISLLGGLTMLAGLVLGFGTMAVLLFENVWLLIRDEGVLLHRNGEETAIAWDELAAVGEEDEHVVLRRASGQPVRWYAGRTAVDVAARVDDARRKAAHGLLRLPS